MPHRQLHRLNPTLNMASTVLQTQIYPPENQRCRRERFSWALSQPKVMTRAGGMPKSQKCSQGPTFVDLKRRKLFLSKDQDVLFFFWACILDESHSNFHMLPGMCFVSACCCILPLLFNTSWSQFSDVFAIRKFGAQDGMGAKGKNDWGVLAESESPQWASSAGLCCWPAVWVREAVLFEDLFSSYAL